MNYMSGQDALPLIDYLDVWAKSRPDHIAYTFLEDGERESDRLSFAELATRVEAVAAMLAGHGAAPGDRVLLVLPPGLPFIVAFLACLRAGVVAVPAQPPRGRRGLPRLCAIAADCLPTLVLSNREIPVRVTRRGLPELERADWLAIEDAATVKDWRHPVSTSDSLAFIQYTSGSTAEPKGVLISHGNLLANLRLIQDGFQQDEHSIIVGWLPLYHDMGLIGNVLQPLLLGARCYLMPPLAFLMKPIRWLRAISNYSATTSGGPNFAYDLCTRRIPVEQRAGLDLSSWRVAFNGAEPVRAESLKHFSHVFGEYGFPSSAFVPCYGLAEATLFVTATTPGQPLAAHSFDGDALAAHRAVVHEGGRRLVSCGSAAQGARVVIVGPDSGQQLPAGSVGEIWVQGASVASGYWQQEALSQATFGAHLAGDEAAGTFLRTGDLGFLHGDRLHVTGRIKDMIIIRGRNHYPQDIELTAEQAHPDMVPGRGVVFAHETGDREELVIVAELVHRSQSGDEIDIAMRAVRQTVAEVHEVSVHEVVLIRSGTLMLTTSGKVRRAATRKAWLAGELRIVRALTTTRHDAPEALAELSRERLAELAPELREATLCADLLARAARLARLDANAIDPSWSVTAIGLDSLSIVEFKTELETALSVSLALPRLLEGPSIEELTAELLCQLEQPIQAAVTSLEDEPSDFPLTYGQRALWFMQELNPETTAFILLGAARVSGRLDLHALGLALQRVVDRHPALRTCFVTVDGEARQRVQACLTVPIHIEDARQLSEAERVRRVEELAHQPFDFANGPLLRLGALETGAHERVLFLAIHHLITDFWSIGLLLTELEACYGEATGGPTAVLNSAPSFARQVQVENDLLGDERGERLWDYWSAQLNDLQPLDLSLDKPRPALQTSRGDAVTGELSEAVMARLEALARAHNTTLYTVLLTAFQILMSRYSGQDDFPVGTPTTGRGDASMDGVMGYFINPVVLRANTAGNPDFPELLRRTRGCLLAATAHQQMPFPYLAERLQLAHDPSRSPVFQVFFVMEQSRLLHERGLSPFALGQAGAFMNLLGCDFESLRLPHPGSQFDLMFLLARRDDELALSLEFNTDLFERETANRLLAHYTRLLDAITRQPQARVADLDFLTVAERARIAAPLEEAAIPKTALHQLFEARAAEAPHAAALIHELDELSYVQLNAAANRLAHHLAELGAGPQQPVAICLERGPELIVAILAVLKAGAGYLPLDRNYPSSRLAFILADAFGAAEQPLVITKGGFAEPLDLPESTRRIDLIDDRLAIAARPDSNPERTVGTADLAYIIYTSGSTGKPKGVPVSHGNVTRLLSVTESLFGFGPEDVWTLFHSYAFDFSVWEIWGALAYGGSLIIVPDQVTRSPEEFGELLLTEGVTVLNQTPSAFYALDRALVATDKSLDQLRLVIFGGEALDFTALRPWFQRVGEGTRLCNMYGITETTVHVTARFVTEADCAGLSPAYIGEPLADLSISLLGREGRPVPTAVVGEILVGGAGVTGGYLGRPALTAERFVPDPFSGLAGARLYRSGDLARRRNNGELEYLGRMDHQVQLRGFRVELGAIESALADSERVAQACVTVREKSAGDTRLIAYVVPRADNEDEDALRAELKQHLRTVLPEYMLPNTTVFIDALPVTASGKVDRRALPEPGELRVLAAKSAAPRNADETRLLQIWKEILGEESLGINDDFFEVGGHSLKATELVARVEQDLAVKVPLQKLFQGPTVSQLAETVASLRGTEAAFASVLPDWVSLPQDSHKPFPLTEIQQAYWIGRSGEFDLGSVSTQSYIELAMLDVDLDRLAAAWRRVIDRHGMLRAVVLPNGEQQVLETVPAYEFAQLDLTGADERVQEDELFKVRDRMSHHVLPAEKWPLFEIRATRLSAEKIHLHCCLDALIYDAWSAHILLGEWMSFYWEPEQELEPIDISFRDYVLTSRKIAGAVYDRADAYWQQRLPNLAPAPDLPLAVNPSSLDHSLFKRRTLRLPAERWQALVKRGARAGLGPSGLLAAAFGRILAMWSKSPRFTLNLTLFQRLPLHAQVDRIVGDFTSLTLLEMDMSGHGSFEDGARSVQGQLFADLDNSTKSGIQILRDLARIKGGPVAMPVVFTSTLGLDEELDLSRLPGEVVHSITQTSQVWLDFQASEEGGALVANWDGVDALFPEGLVDEMFAAFRRLLDQLSAEQAWTRPFPELADNLLSESRRNRYLDVNNTAAPVPTGLLHEPFLAMAERFPDNPAVIAAGVVLSYAELATISRRMGAGLRRRGAEINSLVAIVMEKGWQQVAATNGVLISGAAYLPIDPALPMERIGHLLGVGECRFVLTRNHHRDAIDWPDTVEVLCCDDFSDESEAPIPVVQGPEDIAYVIFTSGSTGNPKGVVIDHRGALNTCVDINARFQVGRSDRILAISALSFDLSVYDIFGTLAAGAVVVLPPPEAILDPALWASWVVEQGVTIWNSVPALVDLYVDHAAHRELSAPTLRLVLMSGDWIPTSLPDRLRDFSPGIQIISMGGATEASIWSIIYEIGEVDTNQPSIPYGKPMVNQSFHVFDENYTPRPDWVAGPLFIGGIGLAQGYWHDREKTDAAFVYHPRSGERLYRTGDLGRYLPDGNIEFLGREDFQVKVQGFRVELGEVEVTLMGHDQVRETIVTVAGDPRGERHLVAYVLSDETDTAALREKLRHYLEQHLPRYMVPSVFVFMERFPLTANGKIDRSKLIAQQAPEPVAVPSGDGAPLEEQAPLVKRITLMVASLLEAEQIDPNNFDPDTNLLALGATSLEVIRLANQLEEVFGKRPSVQDFYHEPTVAALVRFYAEQEDQDGDHFNHPAPDPEFEMILDPDERERFKHERRSLRPVHGEAIALENDPELDRLYGDRVTRRHFLKDPIALEAFSRFLSCLRRKRVDGNQTRFYYPSAGALYPVQVYLHVVEGRVAGLTGGTYYHHPDDHCLYKLYDAPVLEPSPHDPFVNQPIFEEAAFSIFLIADIASIGPIYGDQSRRFCDLEAGYMGQLLMTHATRHALGLCAIGVVDFDLIRHLFDLNENHVLTHSFLGGMVDSSRNTEAQSLGEGYGWRITLDDDMEEGEL